MDVFGTVSFPSDAFKLVLILCIVNQVVDQTQVLDVGQCKSFLCMLRLYVKAQLCCVYRAEIYEHAFGIFIIWDDTMKTRHIANTSVEHFEEMNSNGIFQSDGHSNFVKSRSPISLTANK